MNPVSHSKSERLVALLLFAGVFSAYCLTLSQRAAGYEGETIEQARALVNRESVVSGRAGMFDVALYVPFVALDEIIRSRGAFPSFHGFAPNFALPMTMALTVLFVFLGAFELFRPRAAASTALVFGFATMAWPYAKMGMETALTLATAVTLWGLLREIRRPGRGGYLILAVGLGLILLTKVQAPLIIGLALLTIWRLNSRRILNPPTRGALAGALVILALASAIFVWGNVTRYGRPLLGSQYGFGWETEPTGHYLANLVSYFASPGKSLFIFSPPLILCALLLGRMRARFPWYGDLLLLFVVPQILFHAYFRTWADETWGPRRLLNLLPILIIPIGIVFEREWWASRVRRVAFGSVVVAGVGVQLLAVSMNYASFIWTLQSEGLGSQTNIVWNPETTQLGFQARLLGSAVTRATGGESGWFEIEQATLPWNQPVDEAGYSIPPLAIELSLAPYDEHLDFWWSHRAARDPNWLRLDNKSVYLLVFFIAVAIGCLGRILITRKPPLESDRRT